MRRLITLLTVCFLSFGGYTLSQYATDGFAVAKISTTLLDREDADTGLLIPDQKFYYLAKGGQSYVFLSEDGTTILKFFRSSRKELLSFLSTFLPRSLFGEKIARIEEKEKETLESFAFAWQVAKKETALIAAHLGRSESFHKVLTIVDKQGIPHTIDPNHHPFVLQKRAILVKDRISSLMNRKDPEGAKEAFGALFGLILECKKKGIYDGDPNLCQNFGFIEKMAIQIDPGRYSPIGDFSMHKLISSKDDLLGWLRSQFPELSPALEEAYKEAWMLYETD